jgi:hypothetical protein
VDDPVKHIHAVSVVHGTHMHIDIFEPSKSRKSETDRVNAGPVSINDITGKNGIEHTIINTGTPGPLPIDFLFLSSLLLGLVVASMLGGVLSKENDEHLELAWTKPVSRESYAVSAFAVDIVTIVIAQILWAIMALLCVLLFFVPQLTFDSDSALHIGLAFLAPIAWYAALTGWSASLKRGPGLVIGLGWLFGSIVPGIAAALTGATHPLLVAIRSVLLGFTYIDPLVYVHVQGSNGFQLSTTGGGPFHPTASAACAALALLTIFYLALALAQWRRVEA